MRKITLEIEAARQNLPALLRQANHGIDVVITRDGVPYAKIVGVDRIKLSECSASVMQLRGTGKGLWRNKAKYR